MIIKRDDIRKFLLILVGIFCQTSPMMPRGVMIMYLGFCALLFLFSTDLKKMRLGIGFIWYLLFVILCFISLSYTINTINPDFVYVRITAYLVLLLLASPFLDTEENIRALIKGFFIGGLFGITVVFINQYQLIGVRRIGSGIYGSFAEFGAVCSVTMVSFFYLSKSSNTNKFLKVILFLFVSLALLLSGARKALLISILLPILMQLLDRRKKMSKKVIVLMIISLMSVLVVYASLNDKYLYKFIGYRIESGISSVFGDEQDDASLHERDLFKRMAKEMFVAKPIYGWGMHGFAYKNYIQTGKLVYSHDGFLEILSCYGIIGFILFYWPFAYIFINHKKLLNDDIGIFLVAFIIIILVMEPYSICYLNNGHILIIGTGLNVISERRKHCEKIA